MNQTIKIGDSFALPIQFYDTDTKLGMAITNDMLITAQIINSQNQVIATPVITIYPDQVADAGSGSNTHGYNWSLSNNTKFRCTSQDGGALNYSYIALGY